MTVADALPVGTHKVSFLEVADWTAPAAQDVTVVKDETASVSAAYVRHVGSVSAVTLDGPKDAKWSLNGEGAYESGQIVDALPVGTHKVGFSGNRRLTAPAAQDVTVVNDENRQRFCRLRPSRWVRLSHHRRAEGCGK